MRIKQISVLLLTCLLVFTTAPIQGVAADGKYMAKDEVIYSTLHPDGSVESMYVVNSFNIDQAGEIVDYGDYTSVRNLTDLSDINQTGNKVTFDAEGDFYYQGNLEGQSLPWDLSITYMLDGEEVDPENLAGENGDFEMRIESTANEEIDQTFFEYYMLQIGVTLDPEKFSNIQAPEGTEANEGKNKMINFSILPDEEEVFIISAQVVDFELGPLDISAVPASIGFDSPDTDDLAEDMQELADAVKEINNGVSDLSTGVSDLRGGAVTLRDGSNEFQTGLNELNNSSGELINGSEEILNAFRNISSELGGAPEVPDLTELKEIPDGLRETATGIEDLNEGLRSLEEAIEQIPEGTLGEEQFTKLEEFLAENEAEENINQMIEELKETYEAAQVVKGISEEIPSNVIEVNKEMASVLEDIADGLDNSMEDLTLLDDIEELQNGILTMASEYEDFHNGLVTYTNGVAELTTNYHELNNGTSELTSGIVDLENGVSTLHDGTKELRDSTSDLPDQFQSEIDEFMDEFDFSDYEPISFVSDKNEDVSVVQFVMQTESITKEEVEEEPDVEKETKNLWERFLDLFR